MHVDYFLPSADKGLAFVVHLDPPIRLVPKSEVAELGSTNQTFKPILDIRSALKELSAELAGQTHHRFQAVHFLGGALPFEVNQEGLCLRLDPDFFAVDVESWEVLRVDACKLGLHIVVSYLSEQLALPLVQIL